MEEWTCDDDICQPTEEYDIYRPVLLRPAVNAYKSAYTMVLHASQPGEIRPCYTLTVAVALCGTAENLTELRDRVADKLPPSKFGLRFRFDYEHVVESSGDKQQKDILEKRIQHMIMMAHFAKNSNKFNTCGTDFIYIE
jgi:hypothetical protein